MRDEFSLPPSGLTTKQEKSLENVAFMELAEFKAWLRFIRARIRKCDDRLKSECEPVEIDTWESFRNGWQILEQIALTWISWHEAKISRDDSASRIAQLEKELSSSDIDTAPPVTLIEEETFPNTSYWPLDLPTFPPPRRRVSRQLSKRQYVEKLKKQLEKELEVAKDHMTAREAEIVRHEREFAEWMEELDEWMKVLESNESLKKKLAAELIQMGNRVSTSAASPAQSAANKDAIEPEPAVEVPQPSPAIPTPSAAQETPLESNPTQPPQSETPVIAGAIPAPEQIDAGAPVPLSNRPIYEKYQDEYKQKTGKRLRQKDILNKTKYSDRTELGRWLRQDSKYFNEDADKIFRELFTVTRPHLK